MNRRYRQWLQRVYRDMNERYKLWTEKFHRSHGLLLPSGFYSVAARCYQSTRLMVEVFPELDRVEGTVVIDGETWVHSWCVVRETGEIVDPTVSQYYAPHGVYLEGTPIR